MITLEYQNRYIQEEFEDKNAFLHLKVERRI
jgi:hypothetical protein